MTLDDAWRDQKAYRYDGSHQLIAIEHADGARSEYEYDALGRRVAKHHTPADGAQQTTLFMWDGDWMMQEVRTGRTSHEDRAVTYVPHPDHDGPLTRLADGQAWHYVTDHLGTPQERYDEQREVVWAADLSAYGRTARWLTRVVDNPIRFPGQYRDEESGLHYNRFRYYDPMVGRYINQDPIGLDGDHNGHAYAKGNPLSLIDPTGEIAFVPILVGIGAGYVFDYLLEMYKKEHCTCRHTPLTSVGNAVAGGAIGGSGSFASKPRGGIAGGGAAGSKTSPFSQMNHAAARRGWYSIATRNGITSVLRKLPYVGMAVATYEIHDAVSCE
ncbi:RHS repeat-associated core domain-containing protein [Burkholderia multivorans]|uniref:RHS repeat-associated core domain-containing protein n=1 Tax=Burkholderia multivorans TaxID=87883 RepID=UPI00358ED0C2